jgi:Ca2+-binding RTX toxin-like protein
LPVGDGFASLFSINSSTQEQQANLDGNQYYAEDMWALYNDGHGVTKTIDLPENIAAGQLLSWGENSGIFSEDTEHFQLFSIYNNSTQRDDLYVLRELDKAYTSSSSYIQFDLLKINLNGGDSSTADASVVKTKKVTYQSLGLKQSNLTALDAALNSQKIFVDTNSNHNTVGSILIDKTSTIGAIYGKYLQAVSSLGLDYVKGIGNDIYNLTDPTTLIDETYGTGKDIVNVDGDYTLGWGIEDLKLLGLEDWAATGNNLQNFLYGNSGDNVLDGEDGDDKIYAGQGNDVLIGGAGNDLLDGGAGLDTVDYSLASQAITANLQKKSATGQGSDQLISIENIIGSSYNDILTGQSSGTTTIDGGQGNDTIFFGGKSAQDILTGGRGQDTFVLSDLSNGLTGGNKNNRTFDKITDFNASEDSIKVKGVKSQITVTNSTLSVSSLTDSSLSTALSKDVFGANTALAFGYGDRTFLAINDSKAGFDAGKDAIIEITGYSNLPVSVLPF